MASRLIKAVIMALDFRVISAHSNNHNPMSRGMMMKAAYADAEGAAPSATYETGEIRFSANVNASFEIE